jgi:hypothetical protein
MKRTDSSTVGFTGQCFVMVTSAEACCCYCSSSSSSSNQSSTSLAPHLILRQCQQPDFHWWLPPQVLFFFPAMALRPTIVCLVYTTYDRPELQKHYTSKDTNVFHSENKTHLKLRCNCIWNSSYLRVPKTFLVRWQLCVACYYPTTPTDYPSTTKDRSVGPPAAVNIDIRGYLRFLSITFVWIIRVQYATDNLSGQERVFASWASVDISTHSEWWSKQAVSELY